MAMRLLHANNASLWTGPTGNNTYLLEGRIPALVHSCVGQSLKNISEPTRHSDKSYSDL
jgi:hypothetical protein